MAKEKKESQVAALFFYVFAILPAVFSDISNKMRHNAVKFVFFSLKNILNIRKISNFAHNNFK